MNLNLDVVPSTLEQAVDLLCTSVEDDATNRGYLKANENLHHGFGMWLRNNWSLWNTTTPLVKHFIAIYGLSHADDISGIILEAVANRLRGLLYDPWPTVEHYKAHWRNFGVDPLTGQKVQG